MENTVIEIQMPPKYKASKDSYEQVQNTRKKIRELQKEKRTLFLNNKDYHKVKMEQLEANREVNFEKRKLSRLPEIIRIENQIKKLKDTLKVEQLTLFTEIDKYTEETGQFILPLDDERKVIEKEYKFKKF